MTNIPTRKRFRRVKARDLALFLEAAILLAASAAALRILPFNRVVKAASRNSARQRPIDDEAHRATVARVKWAIEAAARRMPLRLVCFQKGLAAQRLLKRQGLPAVLHYGINPKEAEGLKAHVWVTSSSYPVVGHEVANQFACVASFPAVQLASADD